MNEIMDRPIKVGVLIEPGVLLMDVVGVQSVFGFSPGIELYHVGKTRETVLAWGALPLAATTTYKECPLLDVLVAGAMAPHVYSDPDTIAFIQEQEMHDPYFIGICAGALLYGAAGLLQGRRATTNLQCIHRLAEFGCDVVEGGSVVEDGKLFTAGPATGGFEAALLVLSRIRGEHAAKLQELNVEYHPTPVFGVGTTELAGPELTKEVKAFGAGFFSLCADEAASKYRPRQTHVRSGTA